MEQRKINLSESAYADLESIEAYIAQDSAIIARNFINTLFNRIEQLYTFPESGKVVPEFENKAVRELRIKKYRIVYQILSPEEIMILRVIHGSRLLDLGLG